MAELPLKDAAADVHPEMSTFRKITVFVSGSLAEYDNVPPVGSTVPFTRTLPG
jgi:hypothetical protein